MPISQEKMDRKTLFDLNVLSLSMVGDGVHTLFLRSAALEISRYSNEKLHTLTAKYACAEAQALAAKKMLPLLSDEEKRIFSKGKNSHPHTIPKHASIYVYHLATAFEAVTGFLYLAGDNDRLAELYEAIYGDWLPEDMRSET